MLPAESRSWAQCAWLRSPGNSTCDSVGQHSVIIGELQLLVTENTLQLWVRDLGVGAQEAEV